MPTLVTLSSIFLFGFLAQWAAWHARLPAILFLLLVGIALGPALNWLHPDELFGDLLFPIISLSVAVILFEGALTLKFDEVRQVGLVVRRLVVLGAMITWAVVALATWWIFDLSLEVSVLFGAVMVVTGPTVIIPMLRTVRPTANVGRILRWEGIIIDPIGALLAVVVYEFIATTHGDALSVGLFTFLKVILVGMSFGIAGGYGLAFLLRRHLIPEYLYNFSTLTVVFTVFSLSNFIAHESGLLAVTVLGMWMANAPRIHTDQILNFKENLTILLISGLFIILAARIELDALASMGLKALLLLLIVQLVARPLSVMLCTLGSQLNWRERLFLSWVAPRGIVAAAVVAVFALQLRQMGEPNAELLVPLTFSIIIGTVLLQSVTAKWVARMLKVAESSPSGFLIVGANNVAQTIGKTLQSLGYDVLLCDSNWQNIKSAKMAGLNTFYGSPVSEYADQKLDLVGLGRLMALSPYRELNALSAMRYRGDFGHKNIFTLQAETDSLSSEKHRLPLGRHGYLLFNKYLTYSKLASLLRNGAEIKRTKLSEEFSYEDYSRRNAGKVLPLFAISPKGRLEVFTDEGKVLPEAGWTIIGLSYENAV